MDLKCLVDSAGTSRNQSHSNYNLPAPLSPADSRRSLPRQVAIWRGHVGWFQMDWSVNFSDSETIRVLTLTHRYTLKCPTRMHGRSSKPASRTTRGQHRSEDRRT